METLRRDAPAVARRIAALVAVDHPTKRAAWLPAFRERYDAAFADGQQKGINFSLSVAIESARLMASAANNASEHGAAANLLGAPLQRLGERESGTARLEQALAAYDDALAVFVPAKPIIANVCRTSRDGVLAEIDRRLNPLT